MNYLDRDGLGALVRGLENYQGGVVIISHNEEFCNSVCQQKWIMDGGRLREEGEIQLDEDTIKEQAGCVRRERFSWTRTPSRSRQEQTSYSTSLETRSTLARRRQWQLRTSRRPSRTLRRG